MNFFKIKTTWSNLEFIPLKLCIAAAYLFIGTCFHELFKDYLLLILAIFGVTVLWSLYLWISKMKNEDD